jgi:putative ABC transport system permease protein
MIEAALVGVVGAVLGLALAVVVGVAILHPGQHGGTRVTLTWAAASVSLGLVIAALSIALPAGRDARALSVAGARRPVGRASTPRWLRYGIDLVVLASAGLVFWLSSRSGYQLVLAVEGVPTISVSYWTLLGPLLFWTGAGLLAWRLTDALLRRRRGAVRGAIRPLAGPLAGTVAAAMAHQRRVLARGVALLALTVAYAISTAVFNTTYRHQAEVDALLTNGADVTVTVPPGSWPATDLATMLRKVSGVRRVEALRHRYAYVGTDLQDLYGVDPTTIASATSLQDAYFAGGTARGLMARLAATPDAVLVSAETVHDFQLVPGDRLLLRLQDPATATPIPVTFHYVGVVKEFPTAPSDSFVVANQSYVAAVTGSQTATTYLVSAGGQAITKVAERVRAAVGASATVSDIATSRRVVGSSLTAVDLSGLTRIELGFAVALAAAATGLVLWLGLAERRRAFTIATALGATPRQLGGFVWSEAAFVTILGLAMGAVTGGLLAEMLTKVLTNVFDPPPASLAVPWGYLTVVAVVVLLAEAIAAEATILGARHPSLELLRDT